MLQYTRMGGHPRDLKGAFGFGAHLAGTQRGDQRALTRKIGTSDSCRTRVIVVP
jgi:hypothetical protein